MPDHSSQDKRSLGASKSISELLGKVLEPAIARRTGMRLDLMTAWSELAGPEFSDTTRPEKINWPRRAHEDDPFQPATLVVACEPSSALFFQHSQAELLERVNRFFGFEAIARIRILQKPVTSEIEGIRKPEQNPTGEQIKALNDSLSTIEDPQLRETLLKLGQGILSRSS